MENTPATPEGRGSGQEPNDEHMDDQSEASDDPHEEEENEVSREVTTSIGEAQAEQQLAVAEGPTDYSLFSNPANLASMRQRLFEIEDVVEMSSKDFEAVFPFVDNVWRKLRTGEPQKEKSITTEWYWCRLRRGASHKQQTAKPTPEGKQLRKKRVRDDKVCGMALKVIYNENATNSCTIVRGVGKDEKHTHDLDYVDATKRNSGIMDTARREAIKGFLPTSVFWKMWEEPEKMAEAGGKFMKVSDVRNVQYPWRQENPTIVLKAHAGYSQSRTGARNRQSSPARTIHYTAPQVTAPIHLASSAAQSSNHYDIPPDFLHYPEGARGFLEPYLLDRRMQSMQNRPHITLTWATSLDSKIAILPGVQTAISSPETKAMTHYLRSRHDAVVIGVRTAMADDPSLNCRLQASGGFGGISWHGQPRPIIIDPHARLYIRPEMKILKAVKEGRAKAPWIVVAPTAVLHPVAVGTLKAHGGEFLMINDYHPEAGGLNWEGVFNVLFREGIRSIMVEGGGVVLSELLKTRYAHLIDSVIVTIAPTFFGKAGVPVSPDPTFDDQGKPIQTRLKDVRWQPMGEGDVIMCGHPKYERPIADGTLPTTEHHPPPPITSAPESHSSHSHPDR